MKEVRCAEVGFAGCEGVVRGESEEEILVQVAEHAKSVHGLSGDDIDDALVAQVRSQIREV